MIFFTSDNHWDHANVLGYSNRPFANVLHMNDEMIRRWNVVVKPTDTVYHVGDFAFASKSRIAAIRSMLLGKIILIRGNHDRSVASMLECGFDEVHNRLDIELDGRRIHLQHIPVKHGGEPRKKYPSQLLHDPDPATYDLWLCGHVHEKWRITPNRKIVNVGVDQWDYTPVSMQQIEFYL